MKLSAKNITIFTAIAFTAMSQSFAAAQTATDPTSPISQIEMLDTELVDVNAPVSKVTRQSSWAGKKVALRGKDVVSYHKNDKPLKGSKKYVAEYDDTTWRFSSEENRDEFLENPKKYVPQFGGYCPVALSKNHAKVGTSTQYKIVDDQLYMNFNRASKNLFSKDPDNFLVQAKLNF